MGYRIVAVIVGIEYLIKNDATMTMTMTMTMCNNAESEIGNKEICSPNPKTVDASTKFRALATCFSSGGVFASPLRIRPYLKESP
jgi:hypothetical protein